MLQAAKTDELIKKVQMLIEQNELLRKHNLFLLEENTSIEREFVEYKRQNLAKEQELQDQLQALVHASTHAEQQRNVQFEQQRRVLQAQLRALEQGIDELYNSRG
jgi:uncharacterized protein YydD (DUF2326 family)